MARIPSYLGALFVTFGVMMGGLTLQMVWFDTPHLRTPWFWVILGFYLVLTVFIGESDYRKGLEEPKGSDGGFCGY